MMKSLSEWVPTVEPSRKRLIRLVIFLFAVFGCCAQVIKVSILYFEYRTTTQVKLDLHDCLNPHSMQICIRYGDILDRVRLQKETGHRMMEIVDLDEALAEESRLTLKQIFDLTPGVEDVISACFYRSSELTFAVRQQRACNELFNVTKSFTLEFMCYRIHPISQVALSMAAAVQSRYKQFTIFDLTFNETFKTANYIVLVAYIGTYPYESRRFSESALIRSKQKERRNEYNWINVFTNDFVINRLEAPYDTRCIRRVYDEYFVCKRDCLVSRFRKKFHKLPFTEFLEVPYDLKIISTAEMNDPVIGMEVLQVYADCRKECYFNPCYMIYTKTTFRTILFKEFAFAVSAMTPTEADIVTQAQVIMSFVEYFSFVASCFGTWFGFSFMSINPLDGMTMRRAVRKEPFFTPRNKCYG